MPTLDSKNKKILYEIYNNARTSKNILAKKVGLSREVVDYRIKNLTKKEIIKKYITIVNGEALKYWQYNIYINLENINTESEKKINDYFLNHEFVKWFVICSGKWDLIITVAARDKIALDNLITDMYGALGDNIRNFDVLSTLKRYKDVDVIFLKHNTYENFANIKKNKIVDYKISNMDIKILSLLSVDAQKNLIEVASKVGLTAEAVSYRIKRLRNNGIIKHFRTVININKLGYLWYMLLLELEPLDAKMQKSTETFCKINKNIFFADKTLGRWNMRIELLAKDHIDFNKTLIEIRNHFKNTLMSYELLIILDEKKQVSLTKGMIKDLESNL